MAATAAAIHRAGGPLRFVAFASSRSRSLLHLLTPARVISSSHAYHPSVAAVVPSQGHPHPPPQQWGPPPPKWSPQGHPPPPTVSNCYQQPHQAPPPPSRNDYQPQRQGPPPPPPRHSYGPPPPAPPPPPQQHLDPIPLWSNHYQQRQGPPAPPAPQRQVDRAVQGGAGEGGGGAAREGGARRRGVLLRARRRLLHAQAAGGAPQGARLSAPLMTTASPPAAAEMHQQCIDTWHKSHSNCPLCRSNITFVVVEVAPPEPEGCAPGDANRNTHEVVVVIDDFEDMCEEQQDPVSIGGVRADRDDRETEDSREGAEEEANGTAGIREEGVHHDNRMSIAEVLQSSMEDELIAARERGLLTGGGESLIQTIQC